MINILNKPTTVKGVFDNFTSELRRVSDAQQIIADKAIVEQEVLQSRLESAQCRAVTAEGEVSQTANAIKNIGELLGVQES